jgi:hypothetical protein
MTGEPPADAPPGERGPEGEDGERGLMGALAGGAAGAYAGHKMHHGVIGAVGGAYAGHKLEDAWKHHSAEQKAQQQQMEEMEKQQRMQKEQWEQQQRMQKEQWEQQRMQKDQWEQQQQQQQNQWGGYGGPPPPYGAQQFGGGYGGYGAPPPPPQDMRGNFSRSSEGTTLRQRGTHDWELVSRCRRVNRRMVDSRINLNDVLGNNDGQFAWGGGNFGASARGVRLVDGGRVLEAELRRVDGSWLWARVHLDERVGNSDGRLLLV